MSVTADNANGQARARAFLQAMEQLGWIEGRNVQIEYRLAAGSADHVPSAAAGITDQSARGCHAA